MATAKKRKPVTAEEIEGFNSHDNRAENLAWVTQKENEQHKLLHGTRPLGTAVFGAKLTETAVRDARKRHASGEGYASNSARLRRLLHNDQKDCPKRDVGARR